MRDRRSKFIGAVYLVAGAWGAHAGVVLAAIAAAAGPAAAAPFAATSPGTACGQSLSPPIMTEWRSLDAESGRLGCPTEAERPAATSPQGSGGREANFAGGTIIWHASGPRAGQVYAVVACYRTYFQFGGSGGWLGLPISDAENTPDGQRQTFEGGALTYLRSPDGCEETRGPAVSDAVPPTVVASAKAPLDLFRAPAGDDYESIAGLNAVTRATAAQYARVRTEALVFVDAAAGLTPLKLFETPAGGHATVASAAGERAQGDGATFFGVQGFVSPRPAAGLIPLKQFHNAATGRDMLIATRDGETDAQAAGYVFARIEGFAAPAPVPPEATPQTSAPAQTGP